MRTFSIVSGQDVLIDLRILSFPNTVQPNAFEVLWYEIWNRRIQVRKRRPASIIDNNNGKRFLKINEPTPGNFTLRVFLNNTPSSPQLGQFIFNVKRHTLDLIPTLSTTSSSSLVFHTCTSSVEKRLISQSIRIPIYELYLRRLKYEHIISIDYSNNNNKNTNLPSIPILFPENTLTNPLPFNFIDLLGKLTRSVHNNIQIEDEELFVFNNSTGYSLLTICPTMKMSSSSLPSIPLEDGVEKKYPITDIVRERLKATHIEIPARSNFCLMFNEKISSFTFYNLSQLPPPAPYPSSSPTLSTHTITAIRTISGQVFIQRLQVSVYNYENIDVNRVIQITSVIESIRIGRIIEGILFIEDVGPGSATLSTELTTSIYKFISVLRSDIRNVIEYHTIEEDYVIVVQGKTPEKKLTHSQNSSIQKVPANLINNPSIKNQSYITTLGFYDNNYELLAIGKLPAPLRRKEDVELDFIVELQIEDM